MFEFTPKQLVIWLPDWRDQTPNDKHLIAYGVSPFYLRTERTLGKLEALEHAHLFVVEIQILVFLEGR